MLPFTNTERVLEDAGALMTIYEFAASLYISFFPWWGGGEGAHEKGLFLAHYIVGRLRFMVEQRVM
jgi:hypothetical protein